MTFNKLNIGCGFSEDGTHFIDLYPRREEVKKYNADTDKIPFEDNFFDEVIAEFIFEHLKDRKLFLTEVQRVLKVGGKFTMITDNAGFLPYHNCKSKIKTHYGGYDYYGKGGDADSHYSLFTFDHIRRFLEEEGFETTVELYNRDKFGWKVNLVLFFVKFTRFKWMTKAMIKGIGIKK